MVSASSPELTWQRRLVPEGWYPGSEQGRKLGPLPGAGATQRKGPREAPCAFLNTVGRKGPSASWAGLL